MRTLNGVQLLIRDDWGLQPLDAGARRDLYEILEERYRRRSTIQTSQIPVDKWHDVIGDPTYADAILDRLVHNAYRIELRGDSMRRRKSATPVDEKNISKQLLMESIPVTHTIHGDPTRQQQPK